MLSNTLTITIDGVANVLTRINQDNYGSEYRKKSATELMTLLIRNSTEKATASSPYPVERHNMFFERTVFATPTDVEKYYSVSAVMRARSTSDPDYLADAVVGFNALLGAQAAAIIGGES
jgi:hypothetical protein